MKVRLLLFMCVMILLAVFFVSCGGSFEEGSSSDPSSFSSDPSSSQPVEQSSQNKITPETFDWASDIRPEELPVKGEAEGYVPLPDYYERMDLETKIYYERPYIRRYYTIGGPVFDAVSPEKLNAWVSQFEEGKETGTNRKDGGDVEHAVKEMNIPEDILREKMSGMFHLMKQMD